MRYNSRGLPDSTCPDIDRAINALHDVEGMLEDLRAANSALREEAEKVPGLEERIAELERNTELAESEGPRA